MLKGGVSMIESTNRAFLYGESVFTTMRMKNDTLVHWEDHFERLKKGAEFLFGPFSDQDWASTLKNHLESRLQGETGEKIIRLTIYRESERGLRQLTVDSVSKLKVHIQSQLLDPGTTALKPLKLRTCPHPLKPQFWPSFLKAGSYLETILLQKKYLQAQDDDVLFLSGDEKILESSVANIFIVRHNTLYTAPLGPNVLDGVMRKHILREGASLFSQVVEDAAELSQLYQADGVFGCNSVRGPFLIGSVDDRELKATEEFLEKFNLLRSKISR